MNIKDRVRPFIPSPAWSALRWAKKVIFRDRIISFRSCRGVIHVGANTGQEREFYDKLNLNVVWIEPIAQIYNQLLENIKPFENQMALNCLITDRDGETITLHISSNNGASSSIFELEGHKNIWPDVHYVNEINMTSATLTTALRCGGVDLEKYDVLVVDTQGSELLVLKGAQQILNNLKYIIVEAANFEAYRGCTNVDEIRTYLEGQGFEMIRKKKNFEVPDVGAYFDLAFRQRSLSRQARQPRHRT